jgi:hypothetical protein
MQICLAQKIPLRPSMRFSPEPYELAEVPLLPSNTFLALFVEMLENYLIILMNGFSSCRIQAIKPRW